MLDIRRAAQHFHSALSWLSSDHHFSFNDFYDPDNTHFSALRVFNDDMILPASGFPLHPHQDMEIITYVLRGKLGHEDSLGNKGVIGPGEVQRMTAGTGILHSEFNASKEEGLHLFQMWLTPEKRGLTPSWEQKSFDPMQKMNALQCVVSPNKSKDTLFIHQDASFYISTLKKGNELEWKPAHVDRAQYVFVADGQLAVNKKILLMKDAARIVGEKELSFLAKENTHFVMWDLPSSN